MLLKKGVFCLSIDVELLWGRHDWDWKTFVPIVAQSRSIIKEILELLEEYNICATWAFVGHLFLDRCSIKDGVKHPEIIRPEYSWYQNDWFANDPSSSTNDNPGWYGRDIVQLIKKYPHQEIACHSFSHLIFGDSGCNKKAAESDIRTCIALAEKENIHLTSFIFPHNDIGHLSMLKKFEFTAYRGEEMNSLRRTKFSKLLALISPLSPPVHSPTKNEGLINIPASMYLPSSRGLRRFIPNHLIVSAAKRGIDRAIKEKKIFHLWTHPEDLASENHQRMRVLEKILSYASVHRKQSQLQIFTMKTLTHL